MRRWSETERHERFGARLEPGTDHDRVGFDALLVGQLDRRDVPVGTRDDAAHLTVDDVHAGGPHDVEIGVVHVDRAVEDNGEPGAELAEQPGGVESHRMGDDLDDAPVADLEAVAERAVDDVAPPAFRKAFNVRELVHQTGGDKNATSDDGVAIDEFDAEVLVVRVGHTTDATGEDLSAVAADFLTTDGDQLRGRQSFTTEVAVRAFGRGIARLAGVDDDHRPSLAPELECGGQSGGRSADDGDVAVPLIGTGVWSLMTSTIQLVARRRECPRPEVRSFESARTRDLPGSVDMYLA